MVIFMQCLELGWLFLIRAAWHRLSTLLLHKLYSSTTNDAFPLLLLQDKKAEVDYCVLASEDTESQGEYNISFSLKLGNTRLKGF